MPKVIYTSFLNKNIPSLIKTLEEKFSWKPEVIISAEKLKETAKANFSDSLHIDASDLRLAHFDYSKLGKKIPIDAFILKKLSNYESNFINWIQDTNGRNFSWSERRRYYYELLNYWNTVINKFKPNLLFSFSWPHTITDYALYLICKHVYSIPVIFIDVIPFFNTNKRLPFVSYEDMSITIDQGIYATKKFQIDPIVEKYINDLRKKNNPFVHSNIINFFKNYSINYKKIILDIIILFKQFFVLKILSKVSFFYKKNSKPLNKKNQMNHFDYFLFKYKSHYQNFVTKNNYKLISSTPDYSTKYIYFPGNFEPEAQSNLVPGKYEDPFLILDMLASELPKNWKIFYKEHPATFIVGGLGGLAKDKTFYEKLKCYDCVEIIPFNESTFKLIDNSEAVISAGGTPGWEAMVREKPCLLFGSQWYQGCSEVLKIDKLEDLRNSITKIKEGFLPNLENIKKFTQCLYLSLLDNGEIINSKKINLKSDEQDIIFKKLAKDINQIYQKFYCGN